MKLPAIICMTFPARVPVVVLPWLTATLSDRCTA